MPPRAEAVAAADVETPFLPHVFRQSPVFATFPPKANSSQSVNNYYLKDLRKFSS